MSTPLTKIGSFVSTFTHAKDCLWRARPDRALSRLVFQNPGLAHLQVGVTTGLVVWARAASEVESHSEHATMAGTSPGSRCMLRAWPLGHTKAHGLPSSSSSEVESSYLSSNTTLSKSTGCRPSALRGLPTASLDHLYVTFLLFGALCFHPFFEYPSGFSCCLPSFQRACCPIRMPSCLCRNCTVAKDSPCPGRRARTSPPTHDLLHGSLGAGSASSTILRAFHDIAGVTATLQGSSISTVSSLVAADTSRLDASLHKRLGVSMDRRFTEAFQENTHVADVETRQ